MTSENGTPKTNLPYGLWPSPLSPAALARDLKIADAAWDSDGTLVWLERRPERSALVVDHLDDHAVRDLNSSFSVRAGLGYGGGDFTTGGGWVYFVEAKSGRIFRQPSAGGEPAKPITPAFGSCGALALSPDMHSLLFIRSYEEQDSLEIVDVGGKFWPQKLAAGEDFYMQPTWHPDGRWIAWVSWNHPNMPWDGTHLVIGRLTGEKDGLPNLEEVQVIAGDEQTAIFQPQFSPDGRFLAYVSDASGWWQIMLYDLKNGEIRQVTQAAAEHGEPAWVQGRRTYGFGPDGRCIYFLRNRNGRVSLWRVDLPTSQEDEVPIGSHYSYLEQIAVSEHAIVLIASGSATPARLIVRTLPLELGAASAVKIVRRSSSEEFGREYYSLPEAVDWRSPAGEEVHGLYYPPFHPQVRAEGSPPLIVSVHGGPTSQAMQSFNPEIQFFTSRGYAVLEVNFRGSSGYGRAYRNLLRGNWGVCDVEDAIGGAQAMVDSGRADGERLVILGGSSGGFTVLKALEDFPGFFKAGICRYGVSNQFSLAMDTHKFELHYSDYLLGPLPQAADVYRQRSPAFFADRIQDALALFQGEDDTVVPRRQSDDVATALSRRGVPHVYHVYPGEGHGFRKPETLEHYYRSVERFLIENVVWG